MFRLVKVIWDELDQPDQAVSTNKGNPDGNPALGPAQQANTLSSEKLKKVLKQVARRSLAAGEARGREQAVRKWQEEITHVLDEQKAKLGAFFDEQLRLLAKQETELLRLAWVVAEHILGTQVEANPKVLLSILRAAAARGSARWQEIRVHPTVVDLIVSQGGDELPVIAGVRVVSDPTLEPGDAVIETSSGRYDLRLASQLRTVFDRLQEEVERL